MQEQSDSDRPASLGALQEEGAIWIEYMDIQRLLPDPDNAKDHDIGALSESIGRFGYLNPISMKRPERSSTAMVAGKRSWERLIAGRRHQPMCLIATTPGTLLSFGASTWILQLASPMSSPTIR